MAVASAGPYEVCTSSHITTPTSHHSVFYRPDALPAAQPTASKTRLLILTFLQLLTYALLTLSLLTEPYQKLFYFSSKFLLHLSYDKNGISGSFTFHKFKLLPNSVIGDPFHHFHSMFQQFNSLQLKTEPNANEALKYTVVIVTCSL